MDRDIKSILVIKLRHIGDVLLTSPVFSTLRRAFPNARITALINSGTEDVLSGHPSIDDIIVFNRKIKGLSFLKKYSREFSFLKSIRSAISPDVAIDLTGGDRAAIISLMSGAKVRAGKHTNKLSLWGKNLIYTDRFVLDGSKHVVMQNLDLIQRLFSLPDEAMDYSVRIQIPDKELDDIRKLFKINGVSDADRVVHVHPTSRWFFKCWPDECMAEIIENLLGYGVRVVVTSSPDTKETERANSILSLVKQKAGVISLVGKTTLKSLAAISQRCALFFGVDSAPMHIAAAVNTPVVALFGPSGVFNWGPWDNNSSADTPYTKRNSVQHSGIHTAIQRDWDCIPCGQDGCDGSKKSKCLDDITTDEVWSVIKGKL
ncbi:MAG: putative lipopolysaccharide heptosyltransferase III [Nitrospirae bacterium]|nr:putative lipopolysaccharide heptosyltransferase III [Nitrospirota bacterium]MBF0535149.1 putative lipopolysaccharide heptosyltransferase III [Nitrospirota bacterium]MBF0615232.1 putative lipopolysaccharide heptosyltransferase III [Nitrospirota bacterium]